MVKVKGNNIVKASVYRLQVRCLLGGQTASEIPPQNKVALSEKKKSSMWLFLQHNMMDYHIT